MAVVVVGIAVGGGNEAIAGVGDKMDVAVVAAVEDSADVHLGLPGVVGNTVAGAVEASQTLPVELQDSRSPEPEDTDLEDEVAAETAVVAGTAVVEHHRSFVTAPTAAVAHRHMNLAAEVEVKKRMAEARASEFQEPRVAENPGSWADGTAQTDQIHQMVPL